MDLGIKDKVALVTGGSKGIGGATATLLAQEGVRLAISARSQKDLDDKARSLREACGAEVVPIAADCSKTEDVETLVASVVRHYGRIDILVNSIGSAKAGSLVELTDQDWHESLALKLYGQIKTARAVFPHMQRQRWGRIVNVIGTHAIFAEAHAMPAGVANAGLMNFTKALAELGGPHGILVNGVNPGTVRTARLEYLMSRGVQYSLDSMTLRRFAEPEEIAAAVVFLASAQASYICGAFLNVDGGQLKCL